MKIQQQEPEGFQEWWTFWRPHMRHTDSKTDARAAYIKALLRGALTDDLLAGAQGYIRFMPEKDKPYIQLAQTWLNKDIWENWADKEREYQARLAARAENVVQMKPITTYKSKFLQEWEQQKREG